jgi:succinoglycan biosynthesis transport protein ExoP
MLTENQSTNQPGPGRVSTSRAVRHHLVLVAVCIALGLALGWLYGASVPASFTSSARVLVDPAVGNPFVPTPTSVRQDEPTSLETEAQVARSTEVLDAVVRSNPTLSVGALGRGLQVTVPPNTQILEISYTAGDPLVAQQVTQAVAEEYLANRARRAEAVTSTQIDRVEKQAQSVVADLRAATTAAQQGSTAERSFQAELATALRNDLVSLRAQRTALENSQSPAGAVISPATRPAAAADLVATAAPVGGAFAGLALGCLVALLLERGRGVVRSSEEVLETGLPIAGVVAPAPWPRRLRARTVDTDRFDNTVRRLRASILELAPRPNVIAVAPASPGDPAPAVAEALATSFARAGHRVVLVRTDVQAAVSDLVVENGLAQALVYDRLDPLELLQPTVEPLLGVLPGGGFSAQSRELFVVDRLRTVLAPLLDAGNVVVVDAPDIESTEGEALVDAAGLTLLVVTANRTRRSALERAGERARSAGATLAAVLVGPHDAGRRPRLADDDRNPDHGIVAPVNRKQSARPRP